MNKEKDLIQNTAIITFGKACTQLISFFLLPLYTSALSTGEYGVVDLVLTYSSLFLPFITLALEQALFRFLIDVRDDKERASRYITTTIFASIILLGIVLIVFFLIYICVKNTLLLYFLLVLIGNVISSISLQICRGLGDNVGFTFCSTLTAIVQIICNIIFIVVFRMGAQGMMLATFIGLSASAVVPLIRCRLLSYLRISYIDKQVFKELSRYSMPLIPNQLSWWALNASDKVIVQFFIGVAGNGLIAVASKFSNLYIQFSNIFNISWTESATLHIRDDDAEVFFSETINTVYTLFLCACCGIISCMPFIFPLLINRQFNEAYGLIPIFLLASLCNVVVSLYGVIYVAHKKTVEIAKTAIYAAALNAVSHLILIRFIGIYAAPISTALGYGGMAVYRYFHSRKYMIIRLSNKIIFFSIIMLLISFLAYYSNQKLIQAVALLTIFCLSIVLNKNVLESLIKILKNSFKGLINK